MSDQKYYKMKAEEIFSELNTDINGLTTEEAKIRAEKYGKNELVTVKKVSNIVKFLLQLKDVFMILLLVAAVISFAIGSYSDGTIMLMIVILNAVIGFVQEFKAEKIVESLKKLVQSPSKVFRDGNISELHQENLVIGDIVSLDEGDKVPADVRILESFNLKTNDVALTGESLPQDKHSNSIEKDCGLADRDNMAYLGTTVASGNAKGIVVATGMNTEMGMIANLTQDEDTSQSPLQKELSVVANRLTIFAVVISAFLFGGSIYLDFGINGALIYAIGVAVAVVPQALPMQITIALYQGVNNLARRNAVVKKLSAVETLGSTNVIATDKTGTLTKNEMTVKKVWFSGKEYDIKGLGYEPKGSIVDENGTELTEEQIKEIEIMFDSATMASNAEIHPPDDDHHSWYPIGDPTEAALITLSTKLGTRSQNEGEENPELHEFSFDSVRKRMSSVRQYGDEEVLTMKGAMDSILSISKHIWKDGKEVPITEEDKAQLQELSDKYSSNALRVLGVAFRKLGKDKKDYVLEDIERDVVFLGLVAMIDPPKEGVKEAIIKAHEAHIDTFIMTGDHAITAQAIGREINLSEDNIEVKVVSGEEMESISDEDFSKLMNENRSLIFSRVSPEDKLRIVKLLKKQDKIVAVTGDGVNDAPALKSAHIGVAMGQMGTDVSKEAAELILLDDSFPTLVDAIREGRTIYNNLKKTVIASLTSNGAELSLVLFGLLGVSLFKWQIPILAIQILAIDLLAEILPLTALTYDPGSKDIMTAKPRGRDDHIINKGSSIEIILLGILMGGLAFVNFGYFNYRMGDLSGEFYMRATTISYVTIVACQFVNILSRRYETVTIFNMNLFSNRKILYSILISIVMCAVAIYVPGVNSFLKFAPLKAYDLMTIFAAAMIFLFAHEMLKVFKRRKI